MSKAPAYDAVVGWDGEALTVLGRDGKPSGLDHGVLRGKRAVVVLSRRAAQVRATELPPAAPEDLRQLVRLRLGDLFPAGPGELAYSVSSRAEGAAPGPTPIYAARTSDLTEIHGAAKAGGFRVAAILPEAAGSALLARELGMEEALLAAPDGASLGLDVVRGGELTLSRAAAPGSPIEGEVRRTFLAAGTGTLPIVASGGTVVPFADRETARTPVAALLDAPERWGDLDLVPEDVRSKRTADARRAKLRQGGMIAVASFLVLAYVLNARSQQADAVASQQRRANAEVKKYENVLGIIGGQNAKLEPQTRLLERAFTPAQRTSDVAYLVASLVPKGTWLTAMTFERGKTLQIRGTSLSNVGVSGLLKNLGTQRRFRDVKLSFATVGEIESKPVVNFAITAFPVGNVPIEEPKAARGAAPARTAPGSTPPAR